MSKKSIDNNFLSTFIQECAKDGKSSPDDICKEALRKIEDIEKMIETKSNLMGVLRFFKYKKKSSEVEECNFNEIDKNIADGIMTFLEEYLELGEKIQYGNFIKEYFSEFDQEEIRNVSVVIKQLFKNNILSNNEDGEIIKGFNYEKFLQFLYL
jgi:hypothetical protein